MERSHKPAGIVHGGGWNHVEVVVRPWEALLRRGLLLVSIPSLLLAASVFWPALFVHLLIYVWVWLGAYVAMVLMWLGLLLFEKGRKVPGPERCRDVGPSDRLS